MSTELTASDNVARYKYGVSSTPGLESRGGALRNCFSSSKASLQFLVQVKSLDCHMVLKKDRQHYVDFEMNWLRATI